MPLKAKETKGSPSVAVLLTTSPVVEPAPPSVKLVSAVCVRLMSLSAPKFKIAPSDCKLTSSSTNKSGTAALLKTSTTAADAPAPLR